MYESSEVLILPVIIARFSDQETCVLFQNGQTFLMVACQQGEISLARELLDAGIDPNATDNVSLFI